MVAVGYYFETKRSLATGIAVCGSGFGMFGNVSKSEQHVNGNFLFVTGTFTFAPFATLLLEHFSWQNAHLILAGLILNCAIFGALMRPLT